MRLLIIEDDPMVAMIHQEYCKKLALQWLITHVSSLAEAKEVLAFQKIDLVLLDNYLPDGKGVDFLDQIHHLPVIMITAANDHETVKKSMESGVVDYLVKPFTYERFEMAMTKASNYLKLLSKDKLTQMALDNYFFSDRLKSGAVDLPKGLTKITLGKVVECLLQQEGTFTTQTIADAMSISRITIKKYLNYLVSLDVLVEDADYFTSGRPVSVYQVQDDKALLALLDR